MGSKSNTKQIKYVTLKEVVEAAVAKFPGWNKATAMLQYYNLLVKIINKKRDSHLISHLNLLTLYMNGIEYFSTEGRN